MIDDSIEDLNQLIETIQADDWTVTSVQANEYRDGQWSTQSEEVIGVEVELTVYIDYRDDVDESPFRLK